MSKTIKFFHFSKDFFLGIGSVLSPFGGIFQYKYLNEIEKDIDENFYGDWEKLGSDFNIAIKKVEKEFNVRRESVTGRANP